MLQNNIKFLRNFVRQKSSYYNRHNAKKDILIEVQGDLLYGIHPVKLAIKAKRRTIHKIFYNKYSEKAVELAESAVAQNAAVKMQQISRANLDELTRLAFRYKDHHVHQGIVADVSKMYPIPIDYKMPQFPELTYDYGRDLEGEKFVLLMYNILDPMNVGAMLRSALYFGVTKVILAGDRQDLSGMISKTSSGALEMMSIFALRNPVTFLQDLKEKNWQILALSTPNPSLKDTRQLNQVGSGDKPTILVIGSEGIGIPAEVLQCADTGIYIPSLQQCRNDTIVENDPGECFVDSVNVSVATGIAIHHLVSTRS
eukprot:TRINITY_DN8382_c0_g1_i7.p1 TRINITY_DN8382_c0_g1~~TRINITY_DN8382_c0_g1_i7.p1  ORF type:complete len:313 (-),score=35.80 TRINITY_DN8382_c0_g1_i7:318-1256(-)